MISIIAAQSQNRVIGRDNQLPWHLPEDLQHFKAITLHKPILMGRKTYLSIGKALALRQNIVLTHQTGFKADNVTVVHTIDEALAVCQGAPELVIIGGGEIYRQFLPLADCLYLTTVHQECIGDVFFPELDRDAWEIEPLLERAQFVIEHWQRKRRSKI